MELTLPIYVEVRPHEGQLVHHCRPLFGEGVQASDARLGLALGKLNKRLKQQLDLLGSQPRHEGLAWAAFAPALETHVVKLALDLKETIAKCRFLFVTFPALGRRIAFTPALPELWFEVERNEQLEDRATEVLTKHFRRLEKAGGEKSGTYWYRIMSAAAVEEV